MEHETRSQEQSQQLAITAVWCAVFALFVQDVLSSAYSYCVLADVEIIILNQYIKVKMSLFIVLSGDFFNSIVGVEAHSYTFSSSCQEYCARCTAFSYLHIALLPLPGTHGCWECSANLGGYSAMASYHDQHRTVDILVRDVTARWRHHYTVADMHPWSATLQLRGMIPVTRCWAQVS